MAGNPARSGLGFVSPGEVKVGIDAVSKIGTAFHQGSTAPYPYVGDPHNNATDSARAARADAYLIAALYGSVPAARGAIGIRGAVGAATEKTLWDVVLSSIERLAPNVFSEARAAGPMVESADDGAAALQELWAKQIPFRDLWAGHSAADHSIKSQATVDLADKLAALPGAAVTALPAPGSSARIPIGSPLAGTGPTQGFPSSGGINQAGMAGSDGGLMKWILGGALLYAVAKKFGK